MRITLALLKNPLSKTWLIECRNCNRYNKFGTFVFIICVDKTPIGVVCDECESCNQLIPRTEDDLENARLFGSTFEAGIGQAENLARCDVLPLVMEEHIAYAIATKVRPRFIRRLRIRKFQRAA